MATHRSVTKRSRLMQLSVSADSEESGKQSLYPDDEPDLTICSLANSQPSLQISGKPVQMFLRKAANRQTDRETNNDENITSLAEVTKHVKS